MAQATPSALNPTLQAMRWLPLRFWVAFVPCFIAVVIIAMGAHNYATTVLRVPYPHLVGYPEWLDWVNRLTVLIGIAWFCWVSRSFWGDYSLWLSASAVGLLCAMLGESLRVVIVDTVVYGGPSRSVLLWEMASRGPAIAMKFFGGFSAAVVGLRFFATARSALLGILVATAANVFLAMFLAHLAGVMTSTAGVSEPVVVHGEPFTWHEYKYVYSTFLETGLAAFVMAVIFQSSAPWSRPVRMTVFVLTILLINRRFFATFVQVYWADHPFLPALAGQGQFFIETLLVSAGMSAIWEWMRSALRRASQFQGANKHGTPAQAKHTIDPPV